MSTCLRVFYAYGSGNCVNSTFILTCLFQYFLILIGMMARVFAHGPGDLGSIHTKDSMMPPCLKLSIIRYGSRVKWRNPREGIAPLGVVAIEKEPSGHPRLRSPTLLFIYQVMISNFKKIMVSINYLFYFFFYYWSFVCT